MRILNARATKFGLSVLVGVELLLCGLAVSASANRRVSSDLQTKEQLIRVFAAEEHSSGPNSPNLLPTLDQLAQQQFREGDLAEAAALRRRALRVATRAYGSDSPAVAETMTALALAEIDRRRYLDAEPLLVAAKNLLAGHGQNVAPALAQVHAALATIAVARGEPNASEQWAEAAVEIADRDEGRRAVEPLRALAASLAADERFGDSERLLQQALVIARQHDALATARTLSQLGNLYTRQNRFDEALPAIEEATAIDQRELGQAHPFIADDFYDLGLAYDGLKCPEAARRALTFAIKLLDEDGRRREPLRLGYAQRELARVLNAQGETEEAEKASIESHLLLDDAEAEERDRERQI